MPEIERKEEKANCAITSCKNEVKYIGNSNSWCEDHKEFMQKYWKCSQDHGNIIKNMQDQCSECLEYRIKCLTIGCTEQGVCKQVNKQTCWEHANKKIIGKKIGEEFGKDIYECYGEQDCTCEKIATRFKVDAIRDDYYAFKLTMFCEEHSLKAGLIPIAEILEEVEGYLRDRRR